MTKRSSMQWTVTYEAGESKSRYNVNTEEEGWSLFYTLMDVASMPVNEGQRATLLNPWGEVEASVCNRGPVAAPVD